MKELVYVGLMVAGSAGVTYVALWVLRAVFAMHDAEVPEPETPPISPRAAGFLASPTKALPLLLAFGFVMGLVRYGISSLFAWHLHSMTFALWLCAASAVSLAIGITMALHMFRESRRVGLGLLFGGIMSMTTVQSIDYSSIIPK